MTLVGHCCWRAVLNGAAATIDEDDVVYSRHPNLWPASRRGKLKTPEQPYLAEVVWDDFGFRIRNHKMDWAAWLAFYRTSKSSGNIYETPQLLN
jgi:hypothetical protein